jgi:hypothetical protein
MDILILRIIMLNRFLVANLLLTSSTWDDGAEQIVSE